MDIYEQQEKRQRLTLTSETFTLEVLPHQLLTEISSYLGSYYLEASDRPGRTTGSDILLAVALTASKSSWDKLQYDDTTSVDRLLSPASKAVLSMHTNGWEKRFEEFNFYHDPDSYTLHKVDLDDVYLKAILICIDARNNVKYLCLNECINITGRGLEPLSGSSVIQQIDLSLVFEIDKREVMEQIGLCEGIVLPILQSIIEGDSSSLRHIQMPLKWRNGKSNELSQFMEVYNDHLEGMDLICRCLNDCDMEMHTQGERYGIQTATCSKCLECFCNEDDCDEEASLNYCPHRQTYLCSDCCDDCAGFVVEGCGISEINGVYKRNGSCDNVSKYVRQCQYNGNDEEFTLYRCKLMDDTR